MDWGRMGRRKRKGGESKVIPFGIKELLYQLPLDQQPEPVVPDCWDNFCRFQCLVLHLVIVDFLQNTFCFISFLWACRARKTQVEALITPAMMKLCPLHRQDPCQ